MNYTKPEVEIIEFATDAITVTGDGSGDGYEGV